MPTRKLTLLAAIAASIALGFITAPTLQVTGIVRDQSTLAPIGGAVVRLQATATNTITLIDGSYSLDVPAGTDLVIAGARKGYFNGSVVVTPPPQAAPTSSSTPCRRPTIRPTRSSRRPAAASATTPRS